LVISLIAVLLIIAGSATYASGPGTTTTNFLKIGVGARAIAMGGAFTAIADDATALYWNPAGLAQLKEEQLSASYNSWFAGVSQGYLSLASPALGGTLALGANYVNMGKMEGYDIDEEGNPVPIEDFGASGLHTCLGYAVGGKLMFGLSAGMVQDIIENSKKSRYFGTAGILIKPESNFSLGLAVQNLGEDSLPFTLKAGIGVRWSSLTLAVDAVIPQDNDTYFCAGGELWLGGVFALRAGYKTNQDIGPGFTAGIGFKTSSLSLDYAYVPYGDLGATHRVTLGIGL